MQMEQQRWADHIENKCPHIVGVLKAETKRAICNTKNPPIDQMIAINAGGQLFTASKATLTKYPLSVLGILFLIQVVCFNRHIGDTLIMVARTLWCMGMDLSRLSLKQLPLSSSVFIDCILDGAHFEGAILIACNFTGSYLKGDIQNV